MNHKKEYKSTHPSNLRFIKNAKNLSYIINKKGVPYQVMHTGKVNIRDSNLNKIKDLFHKKFKEYSVNITVLSGLTFACPSLIVVEVKNDTTLYESMTISFSENEEKNENASWSLLLVLKQSKKDLLLKIHNFIQRNFKCILRSVHLSEPQTLWLLGISINETLKRKLNCGLSFTCKLPTHASAEIDIFFAEDILSTMWDSVHDCMSDIINFDELEVFFTQMSSHIINVYGIDVSQLRIKSILLKSIGLKFFEQFQIKAAQPEIAYLLLSYIISDCLVTK